jgi:hypothetical protein
MKLNPAAPPVLLATAADVIDNVSADGHPHSFFNSFGAKAH